MQLSGSNLPILIIETELLNFKGPFLLAVQRNRIHEILVFYLDNVRVLHLQNGRLFIVCELNGLQLKPSLDALHDIVFSDVVIVCVSSADQYLYFFGN
jgi:hypothetical protein